MPRWAAGVCGGLQTLALRARHGWGPRDAWSFDEHLCHVTGGVLQHLAENADAWPESQEFSRPEEWVEVLRLHGGALAEYRSEDAETHAPAQAALHWIADHLVQLWD